MKNMQYSDIRLTDALERELLKDAINRNQEYALDRALKQMFQEVINFFKGPDVRVPTIARNAR